VGTVVKSERVNNLLIHKRLSYVDSSGLGQLVSSYSTVHNHGGQLKLCGLTDKVQDLLRITKLLSVLQAYDKEAAALKSFD